MTMQPGDIRDIGTLSAFLAERPGFSPRADIVDMAASLDLLSVLRSLSAAAIKMGATGFSMKVDEETERDASPLFDVTMHFGDKGTLSDWSDPNDVLEMTGRKEGSQAAIERAGVDAWAFVMSRAAAEKMGNLFGRNQEMPLSATLDDRELARRAFGRDVLALAAATDANTAMRRPPSGRAKRRRA